MRQAVTPTERWGVDMRSLLRICNASTALHIPDIWMTVAPLKKDRAIFAMEAAFRRTAESLCFCSPLISHAVTVMVMALAFNTKDPDGVGDALNIFFIS